MPQLQTQDTAAIQAAVCNTATANRLLASMNTVKVRASAASTAISATATETAFDNVSYSIPANTLGVGSVVRINLFGIATSTNSTDTLAVSVYFGSTAVITFAATDVANNDVFACDYQFTIRTAGSSGTMVGVGMQSAFGAAGTATMRANQLASTTIDTTAAQAITVKATWSVSSGSNSVRLDTFLLEIDP